MAGRDSPPPPLDPDDQLQKHIRLMFTYADDRPAKVSLIRAILKKNQEHALPSDLPKDLILEAKVRSSKRFLQGQPTPTADAPIQTDDPMGDANSPDLSHVFRVEKEIGRSLTNDELEITKSDAHHETGHNPTWSSLFKGASVTARALDHFQKPSNDPAYQVEFDEEDTLAPSLQWSNSLVGYFIGKIPPFFAIKNSLEKAWRIKDLEIVTMADGFYLFKFNTYDEGQALLDEGPWFVHGHPLILRRWTEDVVMYRQQLETIPIWVRFPNLNFCFRSSSALSKIASVIGRPICMDHATASGTRFAFARVCIEVGIDAEFPAEIKMKYKEKSILQRVEYAWKPNPCKTCNTSDHGSNGCPLRVGASKPKQIWVPKRRTEPLLNNETDAQLEGIVPSGWNVVKGKKPGDQQSSPNDKSNKPASPKHKNSDSTLVQGPANRFSSLANLDGDSTASKEILAQTTALIMDSREPDIFISGMPSQPSSSIHHVDKSLLPKVPTSSSSAKNKTVLPGVVIKEKGNKNRSS